MRSAQRRVFGSLVIPAFCFLTACAGEQTAGDGNDAGLTTSGSGGTSSAADGGRSTGAAGGARASGGNTGASGGTTGTGGTNGAGGSPSGGALGMGGPSGMAGTSGGAGTSGTSGVGGRGGSPGTGGRAGSGGSSSTGGSSGTGGSTATGGSTGTGGSSSTGGNSGTGGFTHPVVTIDASSMLRTIPRDIYGTNIAAWTGLNNSGETTYAERMKVAGVTQIRWPGGSWADILAWNDIACEGLYDATTDDAITFLSMFGGHMQPIVNFSGFWCNAQHTHSQAVSLAAAWVAYMNVTNQYAIKVWEVGNEDYGSWEQGNTDGTTYGNEFVDYYNSMKAIDGSIEIGAVMLPSPTDDGNWSTEVLAAVKAKGVTPDFFVIHEYPYSGMGTGAAVDAAILANVGDISGWTSSLNQQVSETFSASAVGKIGYRMTEYSGPLSPTIVTVEYVQALFVAQFILELASNDWSGANLWAAKNGAESGGGDWGFLDANNTPHPDYYVFPILAGKFGSSQVAATSANSSVRVYAAKDSSGNLTVFFANNSPTTDVAATVNLTGFTPASSGSKWVLLPAGTAPPGAPQEAAGIQINGEANPDPASLPTLAGVAQAGGSSFTVDLPASAMVLVVLPPS